jgi:hypothetical protein
MHKKILILLVLSLVLSPFPIFCGNGNGNGNDEPIKVHTATELKEQLQLQAQALEAEANSQPEPLKAAMKNQNQLRIAVQAMISMENHYGVGPQISELAKSMNNSVSNSIQLEAKLKSRNSIARRLLGGDQTTADLLLQETKTMEQQIAELEQLIPLVTDEEMREELTNQLTIMTQEHQRLQSMAENEAVYKGVVGWLWKLGAKS